MLSRSSLRFAKPILPNLVQFTASTRGVCDHLLATQGEGFGVSLVNSMSFNPKQDVDTFTLHQLSSAEYNEQVVVEKNETESSHQTSSDNKIFAKDLKPFTSVTQPIGCYSGTVSKESCDAGGKIHTGVLATLADVQTSIHLWGLAGPKSTHVSVAIDLNMTSNNNMMSDDTAKLLPSPGDQLVCITRCPKMGRQLAFLEFSLYTLNKEILEELYETAEEEEKNSKNNFIGNAKTAVMLESFQSAASSSAAEGKGGKVFQLLGATSSELRDTAAVKNGSNEKRCILAYQSSLLHLFGTPFATGFHEKAFIQKKEDK